jgi:DNA-directed RNA polymerase sigma subunit (sigma70/sigma32)
MANKMEADIRTEQKGKLTYWEVQGALNEYRPLIKFLEYALLGSNHENNKAKNIRSKIDILRIEELNGIVDTSLNCLSAGGKDIMKMYFGLPPYKRSHSLEDIGEKYKITRERARQKKEKCFQIIRKNMPLESLEYSLFGEI